MTITYPDGQAVFYEQTQRPEKQIKAIDKMLKLLERKHVEYVVALDCEIEENKSLDTLELL